MSGIRAGMVAFSLGVVLLCQLPTLPDALLAATLPGCLLVAWRCPRARSPALLACGFLWALLRAHCLLTSPLPEGIEGRAVVVEGRVSGLPARDSRRVRFTLDLTRLESESRPRAYPGRVRLGWYRDAPPLVPGERWRLKVRLKRPRGLVNQGGFDFERWLFRHGIAATGFVLQAAENRRLHGAEGAPLDRLRRQLAMAQAETLGDEPLGAVIAALSVGVRTRMTADQWQVLRRTGTNHLMAISGLHIGLVAGLVFLLVRSLWSLGGHCVVWIPAPRVGAVAALMAAIAYAALAGFAIPTQRALVMLVVLMCALGARRRFAPSLSLATALSAVLLWDPFAVLSAGFWLSFAAVAVILTGMGSRLGLQCIPRVERLWWRWGRVQWLVALGLLPMTMAFYLEYPLVTPLANLFAVPWTGFVVVPAVLAATGLLLPSPEAGTLGLALCVWLVKPLWGLLAWLATLELTVPAPRSPGAVELFAAGVGVLLLILPRGVPARVLGWLWLAPLLASYGKPLSEGSYRLDVLDVGQGLSVVVRTRGHTLVYDTGPRYPSGFDAGRSVLSPFLRHVGRRSVDTLIISHGHRDHVGGSGWLLESHAVGRLITNVPVRARRATACREGLAWRWDGVAFRILHPDDPGVDNNASCVLRVSGPGGSVLLPGDVQSAVEEQLTASAGSALRADILVVPHHGARSSSTPVFLDAVEPRLALVARGHGNSPGYPHEEVLKRLAARAIDTYDTARHGAIGILVDAQGGIQAPRLERVARSRIWRAPP